MSEKKSKVLAKIITLAAIVGLIGVVFTYTDVKKWFSKPATENVDSLKVDTLNVVPVVDTTVIKEIDSLNNR